jgi:hypothetical protein
MIAGSNLCTVILVTKPTLTGEDAMIVEGTLWTGRRGHCISIGVTVTAGRSICTALVSLCLVACGDTNRIVTVTCGQPPGNLISVRAKGSIGFLDPQHFVPGMILEVTPGLLRQGTGGVRVAYVLYPAERQFLPRDPENVFELIDKAKFRVRVGEEVYQSLKSLNIDLERRISNATVAVHFGATRKMLRDPLSLMNADRAAINVIRQGEEVGHRYFLVYAASYGRQVKLQYGGSGIAGNTIYVSNFFLHVNYECPTVNEINTMANSSGGDVPLIFFCLGIRFVSDSGGVEIDNVSPGFTALVFDPSAS